jgi:Fur family peroxide stress response transcriptional regulator
MSNKPKMRLTNQKKMILNYLQNTDSHPTAEEIFLAVRNILPQISFATIYRNLKNLVNEGYISTLAFEKGPTRYDAHKNPAHFICRKCKKIYDITQIDHKKINKKASKDINAQIESNTFYFFGICEKCLNKAEKKVENQ